MWELKSHEYIENHYIMDKLKARLQKKQARASLEICRPSVMPICVVQVYNQLVCNCHKDSKLLGVIDLVEKVYWSQSAEEKELHGQRLQEALAEFLDEFLHHMEEEEKVGIGTTVKS